MNAEMIHFQRHWLFVNMSFTKEDKSLIKNLFELKGYNARHLVREFSRNSCNVSSVYKLLQSLWVTGSSTVVLAVANDAVPALILFTNWCYTKMASREIIIICIHTT